MTAPAIRWLRDIVLTACNSLISEVEQRLAQTDIIMPRKDASQPARGIFAMADEIGGPAGVVGYQRYTDSPVDIEPFGMTVLLFTWEFATSCF